MFVNLALAGGFRSGGLDVDVDCRIADSADRSGVVL